MVADGRHRWALAARAVAVIAVVAGAAWAISAEWGIIRGGFGALGHVRLWWVGAASVAQLVSMTAFVLLQRRLLRAVGGRLPLSWLLSTAHLANAIALAVPFAGSGMAAGFSYRRFRREGTDPAAAAVVLTLAGIFSTVPRSVSPTPGGIGVVEAAMIAALAAAGLRPADAVAAVLIYRLVNSKSAVTAVLFVHGSIRRLRERPAA